MSRKFTRGAPALATLALALGGTVAPGPVCAAAQDETTTIKRDTEAAKAMAEPSYQTREERLKAKPLDWTTTTGKPRRKAQSAAEKKALQSAKPESIEGGPPDPRADDEARRLHPDDWKPQEPPSR